MNDFVLATCELLVAHFRNLQMPSANGRGFHTRVFSHVLHPEEQFVSAGRSELSTKGGATRLEHIVPCRVLFDETIRLIREGQLSDQDIAKLLAKHWRVARLAQSEQQALDRVHRHTMPACWRFDDGDTFARLALLGITLQP